MNFSGCWGNFPWGCCSDRQQVHYWGNMQWLFLDVSRNCHPLAACLPSACWPGAAEAFCFPDSAESEALIFNAFCITQGKVQACSHAHGSCQAMEMLMMALKYSTFRRYCLPTFQNKLQEWDHGSRLTGSVLSYMHFPCRNQAKNWDL